MSVTRPPFPIEHKAIDPPLKSDQGPVPKSELEQILTSYLQAINFRVPSNAYDHSLKEPVMAHFRAKDWPPDQREKALEIADWVAVGIGMFYPYASTHSRVCYGIFTTYYVLIDDVGETQGRLLQDFGVNLVTGREQGSPVLNSLVEWLAYGEQYLGPFANAMSNKCSIEYLQVSFFELAFGHKTTIPKGALGFPSYFRMKTGITEPYAFFVYPQDRRPEADYLHLYLPVIQDLCDYINYTNDILSFYKESAAEDAGEQLTFVSSYAAAHGLGVLDALRELCANALRSIRNVRMALKEYPELLGDTNEFINGYAAWHVLLERYRLGELDLKY